MSTKGASIPWDAETPHLVKRLRGLGDVKTLAELADSDTAKRVMATGMMKEGDVIAYFWSGDYQHMAVRVGSSGITCHTHCRFGDDWNLAPGSQCTFLHFGNDVGNSDDSLIRPFAQAMHGWWVVRGGAGLRFYYFLDDGRVRLSDSAPSTQTPPPPLADNPGYWFRTGSTLLLFWAKGGVLPEFAATGSPEKFTGTLGDLTKLHLTS